MTEFFFNFSKDKLLLLISTSFGEFLLRNVFIIKPGVSL